MTNVTFHVSYCRLLSYIYWLVWSYKTIPIIVNPFMLLANFSFEGFIATAQVLPLEFFTST